MPTGGRWVYPAVELGGVPEPDEATLNPFGLIGYELVAVTMVAAGAAAALQSTVEQVVKDSYAALKALIQRKYTQLGVAQLEANPGSKSRRG